MNELLFKNSFIRDKRTADTIVKAMVLQTRLMKFVYMAVAISLVSSIAIFIFQKRMLSLFDLTISVSAYVIPPLLLVLMCFAVRMHNVPTGEKSEEEFVFTENEMQWTSAGETHTYDIKHIAAYYDTKDYIIVIPKVMPKGRTLMIPAIKKTLSLLAQARISLNF